MSETIKTLWFLKVALMKFTQVLAFLLLLPSSKPCPHPPPKDAEGRKSQKKKRLRFSLKSFLKGASNCNFKLVRERLNLIGLRAAP